MCKNYLQQLAVINHLDYHLHTAGVKVVNSMQMTIHRVAHLVETVEVDEEPTGEE